MSLVWIPLPPELEPVIKPVLDRDPSKGEEWLRAGFEARFDELYRQWQLLHISTNRFAEMMGISVWELNDLLTARRLRPTNLPGQQH